MIFRKTEQINDQSEKGPAMINEEANKSHFEKEKRPNYRYYYHGSFIPFLDKIEESGKFKFKQHAPNLTLSPNYSFKFLESEIKKGPHWTKNRAKHISPEEREEFLSRELKIDDGVMLVIEPPKEYMVHSSSEGRPNVFSTPDQIPDDIDEVVRTRIWNQYQHAMSEESITKTHSGGIKHPGMDRNRVMLPDKTWEKLPEDKRVNIHGELPASSVKMIIKNNPEFLNIFDELRKKLKEGGKIDLSLYKKRLLDYFKNGQGIIKDEVADKYELAENMVAGELEHSIVTEIRKLYLDFEAYKGKRVVNSRTGKELINPIKTKEQILEEIRILNSIEPENEVLKRYIKITTKSMESEL